jgi:hypothetical protein
MRGVTSAAVILESERNTQFDLCVVLQCYILMNKLELFLSNMCHQEVTLKLSESMSRNQSKKSTLAVNIIRTGSD